MSHAGCPADGSPPLEGDVRLVPLRDAPSQSAPCDPVHSGLVQIFSAGVWSSICTDRFGRFGGDRTSFDLDADVVCRQLGFPFGTVTDVTGAGDRRFTDLYDYDYSIGGDVSPPLDSVPVFATRVSCTGKEAALRECFFPEREALSPYDDYFVGAAPGPVSVGGLSCTRFEGSRLGVVCHQFEIEGACHCRERTRSKMHLWATCHIQQGIYFGYLASTDSTSPFAAGAFECGEAVSSVIILQAADAWLP